MLHGGLHPLAEYVAQNAADQHHDEYYEQYDEILRHERCSVTKIRKQYRLIESHASFDLGALEFRRNAPNVRDHRVVPFGKIDPHRERGSSEYTTRETKVAFSYTEIQKGRKVRYGSTRCSSDVAVFHGEPSVFFFRPLFSQNIKTSPPERPSNYRRGRERNEHFPRVCLRDKSRI